MAPHGYVDDVDPRKGPLLDLLKGEEGEQMVVLEEDLPLSTEEGRNREIEVVREAVVVDKAVAKSNKPLPYNT